MMTSPDAARFLAGLNLSKEKEFFAFLVPLGAGTVLSPDLTSKRKTGRCNTQEMTHGASNTQQHNNMDTQQSNKLKRLVSKGSILELRERFLGISKQNNNRIFIEERDKGVAYVVLTMRGSIACCLISREPLGFHGRECRGASGRNFDKILDKEYITFFEGKPSYYLKKTKNKYLFL